jgi:hypothetical protein
LLRTPSTPARWLKLRENGYEIWRDIKDTVRVRDDIPQNATVQIFA